MTPYFITNTVLWKKTNKKTKKKQKKKTMDFLCLRLGVCLRILNRSMGNLPTLLGKKISQPTTSKGDGEELSCNTERPFE